MAELSDDEIHRLIGEIVVDSRAAEAAWQVLRELGPAVAPYLLDAYPAAKRWQDAARALDAILHQNHHYFVDHTHSGRSFWVVNETDESPHQAAHDER